MDANELRFTMDTDPTVKVGDHVYVRNRAGGYLSNDLGICQTWPVLSISNGMVELYGKHSPYMIGFRWRTSLSECVVDMKWRQTAAFNGWRQA